MSASSSHMRQAEPARANALGAHRFSLTTFRVGNVEYTQMPNRETMARYFEDGAEVSEVRGGVVVAVYVWREAAGALEWMPRKPQVRGK